MKYILMMQHPAAGGEIPSMDQWQRKAVQAHMEHLRRFREGLIASGEMVVLTPWPRRRTRGSCGPARARSPR